MWSVTITQNFVGRVNLPHITKQPVMQIEDQLFDRGWVRSAIATRKCRNIYFPKHFMAARPFLTRKFVQEFFVLEVSKHFLEKFRQVHNLKISDRLLRSKSFKKTKSWFYMQRMCTFLGQLACDHGIRMLEGTE